MVCKLSASATENPNEENNSDNILGLMSFIQKSNLVNRNYLKINPSATAYTITSCNHLIHLKCYKQIYGTRMYTFCNFCKNSCNLLLLFRAQQGPGELGLEMLGVTIALLDEDDAIISRNGG